MYAVHGLPKRLVVFQNLCQILYVNSYLLCLHFQIRNTRRSGTQIISVLGSGMSQTDPEFSRKKLYLSNFFLAIFKKYEAIISTLTGM